MGSGWQPMLTWNSRRDITGDLIGRRAATGYSCDRPEPNNQSWMHVAKDGIDTPFCQSDNARMSTTKQTTRLVAATRADIPLIRQLILELAEYERAKPGEAPVTENDLAETLFGDRPAAEVLIAYLGEEPAGFALFFHNYSTWLGKRGIYLEDLFVRPAFRKHGVGFALLRELARIAVERKCGRFDWSVLNWNELAIKFYKQIGAKPMDEWTTFRLTGRALNELAGES
jgi:GNAT superfamily N-acetyltransferase